MIKIDLFKLKYIKQYTYDFVLRTSYFILKITLIKQFISSKNKLCNTKIIEVALSFIDIIIIMFLELYAHSLLALTKPLETR